MKKLLAPLVGLASVATVAAPLATSCTSEASVNHIKSSPVEEVTPKNGIAQYVLVLDRNDYDVNGFKVVVKVADNDKTGAKSQEFAATWIVDGDHLIVDVEYLLTGEEAPEENATVKLNLVVNYGSEWKETVAVKFRYVAEKGFKMAYGSHKILEYFKAFTEFYVDNKSLLKGSNITYIADLSLIGNDKIPNWFCCYKYVAKPEGESKIWFKTIKVYVNGKLIVEDGSTTYYRFLNSISFVSGFLKKTDVVTFECLDCQENGNYYSYFLRQ